MPINIDGAICGSLSKIVGGKHIAKLDVELKPNARVKDLLEHFQIPPEEKWVVFINAVRLLKKWHCNAWDDPLS